MSKIKELEQSAEIGLFLHLFLTEVSCSHFKNQDRSSEKVYNFFPKLDIPRATLKAVKPVKKVVNSSIIN